MLLNLVDLNMVRAMVMVVSVAIAVVTDTRGRRIPNALTLGLAVAGLGLGAFGGGLAGLGMAAVGLLTGAGLFLVPVARLGWGMGDLKLVAALGAVGGPLFALWTALYALAAGGVVGLIWLRQQGRLAPVMRGMAGDVQAGRAPSARSGLAIPFAIAIATGMLLALLVFPGLPR
jgi:prepilin peptidase CpaA